MLANPVIHLVDDDDALRSAMQRLLNAAGYDVLCYASAGEFLLNTPSPAVPGCILLDIQMPGINGLELQAALVKREDSLPVIFMTGYGDVPKSVQALKTGAVDFLTKPVGKDSLLGAITSALTRDAATREARAESRDLCSRYDTLTPREREIYGCLVTGMLNKQVAAKLGISERTVKAHRGKIVLKMQVKSFAQLVHIASQLQLPVTFN